MARKRNIATVEELVDHTYCGSCPDYFMFKMKDNYHEFWLPLSTVMKCLVMADEAHVIDPIPEKWKECGIDNCYYNGL